jgi:hypothetical protein
MAPWHAWSEGWLIHLLKCAYIFQKAGWLAPLASLGCRQAIPLSETVYIFSTP